MARVNPAMEDDHETIEGTASGDAPFLPSEAELVLLCLDYLRHLRRSYPPDTLSSMEGLDPDYLTMACWALDRAFVSPTYLREDNDAYLERTKDLSSSSRHSFPSLQEMEKELVNSESQDENQHKRTTTPESWYEYDDSHRSNSHRFYALGGLASGPSLTSSLTLGEIVSAGLSGLGARSRLDAERDMIQSPLFEQFLKAVQAKGFFLQGEDNNDPEQRKLYEERYRKVVAKFRNKLGSKADTEMVGDLVAISAAEQQKQRQAMRIQQAIESSDGADKSQMKIPKQSSRNHLFYKLVFCENNNTDKDSIVSSTIEHNQMDLDEAEKLKSAGNTHMQRKEYSEAAECYTQALKLCPDGPNSHVYFSNRAAALVSMKKFQEAIVDSERSLALRPDYGKAHARLGLAHFLLGNYRQAMEAYTVALKYEPDNKSSRNYIEKAAKKLAELGESQQAKMSSSFSVVSEWEKSGRSHHQTTDDLQKIADERAAEKYKSKGNSFMADREYMHAYDAYSKAIELCPDGPNSHVYFSNRAAALCYLERYVEAQKDSLKSLLLNPTYGKAHARLGLSRFFLEDYEGAVSAYTAALQYDPDNTASKSYLAKAMAKLEAAS